MARFPEAIEYMPDDITEQQRVRPNSSKSASELYKHTGVLDARQLDDQEYEEFLRQNIEAPHIDFHPLILALKRTKDWFSSRRNILHIPRPKLPEPHRSLTKRAA